MKNLVITMAVVTALTTMIYTRPVLAADGKRGSQPAYGTFESANNLETGRLPAKNGWKNDPANDPKADEKTLTITAGGLSYRVGIDTP